MKSALILAIALATGAAAADPGPEGWRVGLSSNAAAKAVFAYTNNQVRCVWGSEEQSVATALPANLPTHFVLVGEEFSVSNVQDILNQTCAAIPEQLRTRLKQAHLLGPTLQWFVRFVRADTAKPDEYLNAQFHPATFRESDFNATNLPLFASQLRPQDVPPAVALELSDEVYRKSLVVPPAEPGVDYPGTLPEVTYATPFAVGMVMRAPQGVRLFRFRAKPWPNANQRVTYAWKPLSRSISVSPWDREKWPKSGYGLVRVDLRGLRPGQRADLAVFAKGSNGLWGAPSIVSFYLSPYEMRVYANNKEIRQICYEPAVRNPPPFDITEICPFMKWTDNYRGTEKKQIFGLHRQMPDGGKPLEFSNFGEQVLDHHPGDMPKTTKKVRYFQEGGLMRFEPVGDEIFYKIDSFKPRLRGE